MFKQKRPDFRHPKIYVPTVPVPRSGFITPPIKQALLWLVFLGCLVWFLGFSPFVRVKHIQIEGQITPETKTVIEQLKNRNILFMRPGVLQKQLKTKQPGIKDIKIIRGIPDTLKIKVLERDFGIIWQVGESRYLVALDGVIIRPITPDTQIGLPVVVDVSGMTPQSGQRIVVPYFVKTIKDIYANFTQKTNLDISKIEVGETTFQINVSTSAGWRVIFDMTRPLDDQWEALKKVMDEHKSEITEYADIRTQGKVYYK